MNIRWLRLLELGFCVVFLGGCVIGNWNISGPQTPLYHCDAEAERALLHPTPIRDDWDRAGTADDDRRREWVECGGSERGFYNVEKKDGESYSAASKRTNHAIQRCMLKKGYRYIGPCSNAITKAFPGCGAP